MRSLPLAAASTVQRIRPTAGGPRGRFSASQRVIVVNFDAFSYGYYADDTLERKEILTRGRYQRWLISFQTYGVTARNPRANIGMIYGLTGE
jgi:hypothetical protein